MKLDILAFGVHPDDVELSCGATLAKYVKQGKKVGIVDLTRGELGTRGSADLRDKEAAAAAKILGIHVRENLKMADGFFANDQKHQLKVIAAIRKYQPTIVLCNAIHDRHPDHGRASSLVSESCFYSGLSKVKTKLNGKEQMAYRPKVVYHYIQDRYIHPDVLVDVTGFEEIKMKAIMAFSSQFYDPKSKEPNTPISGKEFLDFIKAKMMVLGRDIGVSFAEGFTVERSVGVKDLFDLI